MAGSSSEMTLCVSTLMTGTWRPADSQFGFKRLLEDVADFALGGGVADVERKAGNLAGSGFGAKKGSADLGAVSVGEDDAIAVTDQADDFAGGAASIRQLLRRWCLFRPRESGSCRRWPGAWSS